MSSQFPARPLRRLVTVSALVLSLVAWGAVPTSAGPDTGIRQLTSAVTGTDGQRYSITNHLVEGPSTATGGGHPRREWLLVWAGDDTASDQATPDPDFLAVVDATRGTPQYGQVINTVTIDSLFGNEPHHMQYMWHKGNKVYAGGILSDTTFVFDVSRLPAVSLSGITLPSDTPCGSAPDAYTVLDDGTAYATYMGGADVAGPCTYRNGETRDSNGFAGSPGELVHLDTKGRIRGEAPAATDTAERASCLNIPALPAPSCANPHGIGIREDLGIAVTSDFAEVRNLLNTDIPPDPEVLRDTVRIWDIKKRSDPRLRAVSVIPNGPREEPMPVFEEFRAAMETAVTNRPEHRGAFASTMMGAVFYTPDITARKPVWKEIFDDTTAFANLFPTDTPAAGGDIGSWLMVSPDDRYLYHVVLGGGPLSPPAHEQAGMVYVLDIAPLIASGRKAPRCSIDDMEEVRSGGVEPDCPRLVSALPIEDLTSGGPHWAAADNFTLGRDGLYREAGQYSRIAVSNYFVSSAQINGDHRVCMVSVGRRGKLSLDTAFHDTRGGAPCLDFNRTTWPHGARGGAKPHGLLFAVSDRDLR